MEWGLELKILKKIVLISSPENDLMSTDHLLPYPATRPRIARIAHISKKTSNVFLDDLPNSSGIWEVMPQFFL